MRTRVDSVFVSSVLFTIALVCLIPTFLAHVVTERDKIWLAKLDAGYRLADKTTNDLSIPCLAIILIGLIVVWTGYVKRLRWTWAVMFIVVWVWAFPLLALPLFEPKDTLSIPEWLHTAIYYPGLARTWAESALLFLLMVIALLLPLKSLFLMGDGPRPIHTLSARFIGGTTVAVLLTMIGLSSWIRLSAYEISPAELTSWQQFPVPPPPPNWDRCRGGGN